MASIEKLTKIDTDLRAIITYIIIHHKHPPHNLLYGIENITRMKSHSHPHHTTAYAILLFLVKKMDKFSVVKWSTDKWRL